MSTRPHLRFEQSHDLTHVLHTAGARLRDDVGNECAEFFLVHLFWQESLDYRDFVGFDGCKIVSARIFVLA